MEINLVVEGLRFMILGMSSVFIFLSVMIFVLKLQGRILSSLGFNQTLHQPPKPTPQANPNQNQIDNDTIAAISVAINKFRSQK
ncbi:OadG family protein [Campylobacter sp. 19-13652]|uniref:OadG family protein n=1 Tax=Campylobacter sp. 19-13652 TaxID=2840180 RepID=UPI001C792BFA|nr:OadG family protein [Campylobacter sp. 19-13652]BCX79092.1 hypothetical protein LBC_05540 [Campylobacter sp. 19-13652]